MVASRHGVRVTTLARVDPDEAPGRRLWTYLLALAGVVVVTLSWMVPEPPPAPARGPEHRIEPISYTQCSDSLTHEALPYGPLNYGSRSLSYSSGCAP